jgi:hypothetical protein
MMPLAVVDQARDDGAMMCATTGTAALSASFVALALARAQLVVAMTLASEVSDKRDAATAVMRDLIHPPES